MRQRKHGKYTMNRNEELFDELMERFRLIGIEEIPGIDLYMDQVTTFLEEHMKPYARDPENDKILTRTMINNYTKAKILQPPVKKKYNRDQMLTLIFVYYMKNFLSMADIRKTLSDLPENRGLGDIYSRIMDMMDEHIDLIGEDIRKDIEKCGMLFQEEPAADREKEQRFMLICAVCMEMYIRKLYLEKLVDDMTGDK